MTLFKDAREQSPVISSLPFVAENIEAVCAQTGQDDLSVRGLYAAAGCGKGIAGDFAVCGGNFERSKGEGIKPGRAFKERSVSFCTVDGTWKENTSFW